MNSRTSRSDPVPHEVEAVDYLRLFRGFSEPCLLFEATEPYMVVDINDVRAKLGGVTRSECVGRPLYEVYPYTDRQFRDTVGKDLRERLREMVRTGRTYHIETWTNTVTDDDGVQRTTYVQGTYSPLRDEEGVVRYVLAVARDVTDELHAMERAATAESRLNAALTIGKVGSWVFDTTTKRILGDENFVRLFKMSKETAARFSLDELLLSIHDEDRDRIAAAIDRSVRELVPFEEEYRVKLSDDSQRWVLARGNAEMHDGHTVFPGVVVDITEQRDLRAQVELARQQDLLNQQATRVLQQRNEELKAISRSKDEFVALASHQLRTPATAVKQYIGMVLQGYVGDITEEQSDVLTKAFESNERQIQIINQILSAARADTGRLVMSPIPIDMRVVVRGILSDMETTLHQRQHSLTLDLPEHAVQVGADLGYMRMAIENVIHNANVYTPKGGDISIRLKETGKECVLSVTDTGVGIKKSDLGKLFVKFSRIHNPLSVEAGGSGIGLYLTAEIVRLHGGSIAVSSHLGKGTTFAISLPLMQNKYSTVRASGRE